MRGTFGADEIVRLLAIGACAVMLFVLMVGAITGWVIWG